MNVFVMLALFARFNCRSLQQSMFRLGLLSNRWIVWGVLVMVGLQLLLTCVPVMNRLFHTALLDGAARVPILATAMVAYLLAGFKIWIRRRLTATRSGASGSARRPYRNFRSHVTVFI